MGVGFRLLGLLPQIDGGCKGPGSASVHLILADLPAFRKLAGPGADPIGEQGFIPGCPGCIEAACHIPSPALLAARGVYRRVKRFFRKVKSPSSRIWHSWADRALRSTERKSASCWRLNGMEKVLPPLRLASSDR